MAPIVLTTTEVAGMLACGEEQVELLARRGTLPGLRLGRAWVFPVQALAGALNGQAAAEASKRRGDLEPAPAPPPAAAPAMPRTDRPAANSPRMRQSSRQRPPAIGMPPSMQTGT